ncbi:MAG: hypothetical protein AB8G99_10410 [Planctomycetaceae bacterium]
MSRSVIVFDIDGLSIRSAGCYGNVEVSTPMLNEFAAQSRVFEQHFRSFVEPEKERESAISSLMLSQEAGLFLSNVPAGQGAFPAEHFEGLDQLVDLLEEKFDTESMLAWVRIKPGEDNLDAALPLGLVTKLVEAQVDVVVTSSNPVCADENRIENGEAIRVPLLVWSGEADRVQAVTSSGQLDQLLQFEEVPQDAAALIFGDSAIALREKDFLLLVQSELSSELADVADDDLAAAIDVTDNRIRMFRKPDDVWNMHNVLVEDIDHGIGMLQRLREKLCGVPAPE